MDHSSRIAVTGGGGFLGSHVLAELGAARLHETSSPCARAKYDLTHEDRVKAMLADLQPAAIVHMAAVVGRDRRQPRASRTFFFQNLMMGSLLMSTRAARA